MTPSFMRHRLGGCPAFLRTSPQRFMTEAYRHREICPTDPMVQCFSRRVARRSLQRFELSKHVSRFQDFQGHDAAAGTDVREDDPPLCEEVHVVAGISGTVERLALLHFLDAGDSFQVLYRDGTPAQQIAMKTIKPRPLPRPGSFPPSPGHLFMDTLLPHDTSVLPPAK